MKYTNIILILAAIVLTGCATSHNGLGPVFSIPAGTVKEGTLANQTLGQDASSAIRAAMKGNGDFAKFVVQQPVGAEGMKAWREVWVYEPQGVAQQFIITFQEDGQGSTDFEVEQM
jgi:hypothetical protein